jgi:hypothetical protein
MVMGAYSPYGNDSCTELSYIKGVSGNLLRTRCVGKILIFKAEKDPLSKDNGSFSNAENRNFNKQMG